MKKVGIKYLGGVLLVAGMIFLLGMGHQTKVENKEMVTVVHVVKQGESLWSIGAKYITHDRQMLEFMEGIYELNYDRVFAEREKKGASKKSVYVGDELEIHYWK